MSSPSLGNGSALVLPERLTRHEARAVLAALSAQIDAAPAAVLRLDAAPLQTLDTSALALLMELGRRAQARGLSLRVQAAAPRLRQLAGLYGVQALLGLQPAG